MAGRCQRAAECDGADRFRGAGERHRQEGADAAREEGRGGRSGKEGKAPAKGAKKAKVAAKNGDKSAKSDKGAKNAKAAKNGDKSTDKNADKDEDADAGDDSSKTTDTTDADSANKLDKITKLAGRRVGIVTGSVATKDLLDTVLNHYGVPPGRVQVSLIDPKDVAEVVGRQPGMRSTTRSARPRKTA